MSPYYCRRCHPSCRPFVAAHLLLASHPTACSPVIAGLPIGMCSSALLPSHPTGCRIPTGMAQCRQEANVMKTKWATLRDLPATEVSHQAVAELWGQGRQAGR